MPEVQQVFPQQPQPRAAQPSSRLLRGLTSSWGAQLRPHPDTVPERGTKGKLTRHFSVSLVRDLRAGGRRSSQHSEAQLAPSALSSSDRYTEVSPVEAINCRHQGNKVKGQQSSVSPEESLR